MLGLKHILMAAGAATLISGCQDLPLGALGPLLGPVAGSSYTVQGSVNNPQAGLRVGLLAQPQAGGSHVELASTSASNGSYALQLNAPGIELLQQPLEDKSYIFLLTSYVDVNGNNRFDDGVDRLVDGTGGASFRWFASDSPSYKSGWNVYDPSTGAYSQSFSVAYNL